MPRIFSILAIALTLFIPQVSSAAEERGLFGSIGCFFSSIFSDGCDTTEAVSVVSTQTNTQTEQPVTNTYIPEYNPPAQQDPEPQEERTIIKYITETLTPPPSVSVSGSGASYVYVDEQINLLKQELLERINNTTTRSSSNGDSGISRDTLRKSIDAALDGTATDTDIDNLREEIMETIAALPTSTGGESFWTESGSDIYFDGGRVGIGTDSPQAPLDVSGSIFTNVGVSNPNGDLSIDADGTLNFNSGNGTSNFSGLINANVLQLATSDEVQALAINQSGSGVGAYAMYVVGEKNYFSGNVGIGTSTPEFPLTVSGNTYVTGDLRVGTGIIGDAGANIAFSSENIGDIFLSPSGGSSIVLDGELQSNSGANFAGGATFLNNGLAIFDDGGYVGVDIGTEDYAGYVNVRGIAGEINIVFDGENGNVGIGTSNPVSALDLGVADSNIITIQSDHADTGAVGLISFYDTTNAQEGFRIGLYESQYQMWGTRVGSPLVFGTENTERMRIDSDGNIGIGTTTPTNALTLDSQGGFYPLSIRGSNNTFDLVVTDDSLAGNYDANLGSLGLTSDGLYTKYGSDISNWGKLLYSNANGNVGIGTTDPQYALDVNGSGYISELISGLIYLANGTNDGVISTPGGILLSYTDSTGLFSFADAVHVANSNVGIGTESPEKALEIKGGTNGASSVLLRLRNPNSNDGTGAAIDFMNTTGTGFDDYAGAKIATVRQPGSSNDLLFHANSNSGSLPEIMRLRGSDGFVGIGTNNPSQVFDVNGNARFRSVTSGTYAFDLNLTSDGTLTTSASDRRLKDNIESLNASSTLDKILQLQPSSFTWKADGTADIGLIAQDVAEVFPELTFTNPTDQYMGVNYSRLSTLLISAVQELMNKIEGLASLVKTEKVETREVETDKLCIGTTCVSEEQLQQLLNGQSIAPAASNTSTSSDTDQGSNDEQTSGTEENPATASGTLDDTVENTQQPASEPVSESEPTPAPEPEPESQPEPTADPAPVEYHDSLQ